MIDAKTAYFQSTQTCKNTPLDPEVKAELHDIEVLIQQATNCGSYEIMIGKLNYTAEVVKVLELYGFKTQLFRNSRHDLDRTLLISWK